MDEDELTSMHL